MHSNGQGALHEEGDHAMTVGVVQQELSEVLKW